MPETLAPGSLLAGRYSVVAALGGTDFGAVYAVTDRVTGRECALKLLHPELRQASSAFAAFREAERTVAALPVDAIARASDFGTDDGLGQYFVVSELVGFPSLAKHVEQRGRLSIAVFCPALAVLATSLDAAANKGIFHGDLKPENLFFALEHPSWARISDFGTAALRAAVLSRQNGAPLGWSSPERMQGSAASRADDIFALGLITFFALTGRHYCRSMQRTPTDAALILRELSSDNPSASAHAQGLGLELSAALDPWFSRALAHDPAARFRSAEEAASTLLELNERDASRLTPGIAAAVAAPLLFQELPPRAAAPADKAVASRAFVPSEPRESSEMPRSSRPPSVAPPRPTAREHVDGLPNAPPVALLAGAAMLVLIFAGVGVYATFRLFSSSPTAPVASAAPSAVSVPSAASVAAVPSTSPAPTPAAAHFSCTPEPCEWIVCDGENVKKGVTTLELPAGRHRCSAARYGFRTAVVEFALEDGKTTNVVFELSRTVAKPARPRAKPAKGAGKTTTSTKTKH